MQGLWCIKPSLRAGSMVSFRERVDAVVWGNGNVCKETLKLVDSEWFSNLQAEVSWLWEQEKQYKESAEKLWKMALARHGEEYFAVLPLYKHHQSISRRYGEAACAIKVSLR